MRIVLSGSSGLIGSNLMHMLTTGGHHVIPLSRQGRDESIDTAFWDTETGRIEMKCEEPIDAVVHLAGENIAGRWTAPKKRRIRDSRVQGTRQVVEWIKSLEQPPASFICASAIGFYGNRGDEQLTEQSLKGSGFLSDVCQDWESEAGQARSSRTRVVNMRFGVVLSPKGGALAKMLTPFKMGGGGIIGDGRQFWSWITVDDAAGAVLHSIHSDALDGPVNAVAPQPATNRDFTKTLGKVLRRPTILPMPRFAARAAFGEMADELLLSSQRVSPERLMQTDYSFRHSQLSDALRHLLGRHENV